MKRITNEFLKEEYYYKKLDCGLSVYLIPKLKYNRCYALFSTKFGSCDEEFVPINEKEFIKVPSGVAHFLEHKNFEMEDGSDASVLFSQYGGDVNAYTTYDKTVYLFSGTSNILEQIEVLIDFVRKPFFTKENVFKEQGIIEQEVKMYLDKPRTSLFLNLMNNLYEKNYVKDDIGGSLESIKEIDVDTLYKCYNTFYSSSNMTFVLVGNFDLDKVEDLLEKKFKNDSYVEPIKRKEYLEDNKVLRKDTTSSFDVSIPKVGCAVKFSVKGENKRTIYKNMLILDMLLDIYFDDSSDYYHNMLKEGIIDNSFSYEGVYDLTFAHAYFYVNTNKIDEFKESMKDMLLTLKDKPLDSDTFKRYKRIQHANAISKFNSIEYIANLILDLDNIGLDLFDSTNIFNEITIDDLKQFKSRFSEDAITFHTIIPKK